MISEENVRNKNLSIIREKYIKYNEFYEDFKLLNSNKTKREQLNDLINSLKGNHYKLTDFKNNRNCLRKKQSVKINERRGGIDLKQLNCKKNLFSDSRKSYLIKNNKSKLGKRNNSCESRNYSIERKLKLKSTNSNLENIYSLNSLKNKLKSKKSSNSNKQISKELSFHGFIDLKKGKYPSIVYRDLDSFLFNLKKKKNDNSDMTSRSSVGETISNISLNNKSLISFNKKSMRELNQNNNNDNFNKFVNVKSVRSFHNKKILKNFGNNFDNGLDIKSIKNYYGFDGFCMNINNVKNRIKSFKNFDNDSKFEKTSMSNKKNFDKKKGNKVFSIANINDNSLALKKKIKSNRYLKRKSSSGFKKNFLKNVSLKFIRNKNTLSNKK